MRTKPEIEIQPVGIDINNPKRFDLVGIDISGNRYYLGNTVRMDVAECWKKDILEFVNRSMTLSSNSGAAHS